MNEGNVRLALEPEAYIERAGMRQLRHVHLQLHRVGAHAVYNLAASLLQAATNAWVGSADRPRRCNAHRVIRWIAVTSADNGQGRPSSKREVRYRRTRTRSLSRHRFDDDGPRSPAQRDLTAERGTGDLTHQLRSIRPAYLSTAPPPRRRQLPGQPHDAPRDRVLTNPERDAIDAESKSLLRELNARISTIKRAEDLRNETASKIALAARAKSGLGALGRWAAGSDVASSRSPDEEIEDAARKAIMTHREAVIMYLQKKLEAAGRVQSDMMEVRLGREVEKSKSVLYKSRMVGNIPYAEGTTAQATSKSWSADADHVTTTDQASQQLSPEQMQVLAVENDEMLRHYEDQLDAISTAEKSILEISQLQNTLIANLEVQGQQISQMEQDSYNTEENLGRGNKELKKASERKSTAQALFWGTAAFCSFLVVWDLVI
nr:syntaxin ufe1 [Quercus suber]